MGPTRRMDGFDHARLEQAVTKADARVPRAQCMSVGRSPAGRSDLHPIKRQCVNLEDDPRD